MNQLTTLACIACVSALSFAAPPLCGQQPRDTIRLPELIVTANRLPMPANAVSASVTVITGEQLRAAGIRDLPDALRQIPGIAVVQTGSFGGLTSVFLRGGQSDYVRVLLDGIPVNEPGGSIDFSSITTENVERIEIVRGPASVLYGSDAVSGVIQIITRKGNAADRLNAQVQAGSYGTRSADLDFAGSMRALDFSFAATRFESEGVYRPGNDFASTGLSGQVGFGNPDANNFRASVRHHTAELHFPTDGSGQRVRQGIQNDGRTTISLEAGKPIGSRIIARVLLGANQLAREVDDRPAEPEQPGAWSYHAGTSASRRTADARLDFSPTAKHTVIFGAALEQQRELQLDRATEPADTSLSAKRNSRAVYLQSVSNPLDGLFLNAGTRFERNDGFGNFNTARAGASYNVRPNQRLRLAAGTGFKEPTFFESFATGWVRGNPALRPERSRNIELGFDQRFPRPGLDLSATWFRQSFRDMIQFTFQPAEPEDPNYFNIAGTRATGLELESHLAAGPDWSIAAGITLLRTRIDDPGFEPDGFNKGSRLLRRPDLAGTASIQRNTRRALTSLTARYTGHRDDLDFSSWPATTIRLPAHTLLDLAGEFRFRFRSRHEPGLSLTLRVENLFDHQYQEVLHFPARGRTILAGARFGLPATAPRR